MLRATAPLLAALLMAGPAIAGVLDRALLSRAGQVLERIDAAGHKSVGVLPFRVKKAARPASHDAAPLCASLPGRLENALILVQGNDKAAIRVLRGCGLDAGPWHTNAAALAKLFAASFEPAWGGGGKAKADVFVTGEISYTGGREAQVIVELLEPKKAGARKAASFKVDADLALLRDLGLAFGLEKKARDEAAALAAARAQAREDEKNNRPGAGRTPEDLAGVRVEVLYDGKAQKLTLGRDGAWQAPSPRAGQVVTFALTRLADGEARLGMLLRIDGRSTIGEEEGEQAACQKLLLDGKRKGVRRTVTGVLTRVEGGKPAVRPFPGRAAGARASWIDLDVFAPGEALDDGPESRMSTRALPGAKARTLKELQARLARANGLQLANVTARGPKLRLIDVEAAPFNDPPGDTPLRSHLGGLSIRIPATE
jgi:hypothetical protein